MSAQTEIKQGTLIKVKKNVSLTSQTFDGRIGKVASFDFNVPNPLFTIKLPDKDKPIFLFRSEFEPVEEIPGQETAVPFMFYGKGTMIKTILSNKDRKKYSTLIQNDLYGRTEFVVSQAETLALARQQHEYWINRMTRPELPKFLVEITPTIDITRWRTNVVETTKPVQEAVTEQLKRSDIESEYYHDRVPPLDKTETPLVEKTVQVNTEFSGDFCVMKRFGVQS